MEIDRHSPEPSANDTSHSLENECPVDVNVISGLKDELRVKDVEITTLVKQLAKAERQLDKLQSYNEDLRTQLSTLSSELHKYRSTGNDSHLTSVEVQVSEADIEEAYGNKPMPQWDLGTPGDGSSSIAETLRAAAEAELWSQSHEDTTEAAQNIVGDKQQESDYVYDESSGYYYHPATGYYWDPNSGLFYDYTSRTYLQYDESSGEYKVYPTEDVQPSSKVGTKDNKGSVRESKTRKRRTKRSGPRKKLKSTLEKPKKPEHVMAVKDDEKRVLAEHSICKEKNDDRIKGWERKKVKRRSRHRRTQSDSSSESISEEEKDKSSKPRGCSKEVLVEYMKESDTNSESSSSDSLATGESEMVSNPESGEITSSSSSDIVESIESSPQTYDESGQNLPVVDLDFPSDDISNRDNQPPCIRAIVLRSETLTVGSLHIVTCTGGSIGRADGCGHVIQIPEPGVSKNHAQIEYNFSDNCYNVTDMDSQNGTLLNGIMLSRGVGKKPHLLSHGDTLLLSGTEFLCHIHKGIATCDDCEPGQVQAKLREASAVVNKYVIQTKAEKHQQWKKELKNIKKKYGLQNCQYENTGSSVDKIGDYTDKAYLRRKYVGSEMEDTRTDMPASVHSSIAPSNKGRRLLEKMGWKEGEGLGKTSSGIAEPINVELRVNQSAGLGSATDVGVSLDNVQNSGKARQWSLARQRYQKLDTVDQSTGDSRNPHEDTVAAKTKLHPKSPSAQQRDSEIELRKEKYSAS